MIKNWLAYFCGSFFSHKQARQGDKHNLLNTLLGMILAFIMILSGLSIGNTIYFNKAFGADERFKEFLQEAFANTEFDLTVKDNKASGNKVINSFDVEADKKYSVNGYNLVLDARDLSTSFIEFTIEAVGKDKTITFKEYSNLNDSSKQSYTLKYTYTNKLLDVTADIDIYKEHLKGVEGQDDIKEKYEKLDENSATYHEELYSLYIQSVYYGVDITLGQTAAPTLKDYYIQLYSTGKNSKYLIILDDFCYYSFGGDQPVSYIGAYSTLNGFKAADGGEYFVERSFRANDAAYTTMYAVNLMQSVSIALIFWMVLALILFLIGKNKKWVCACGFTACLQIVGSFVFICGALSAIVALLASTIMTSAMLFFATTIYFCGMLALRMIIFIACEFVIPSPDKIIEKE